MPGGRRTRRLVALAAALAGCGPGSPAAHSTRNASMLELGTSAVTTQVAADPASRAAVDALAAGEAGPRRVVLEVTLSRRPGRTYQVYVGLPPGVQPTTDSPHYVGNLAFYGPREATQSMQYDVTELARALAARGAWDADRLSVTFVPSLVEMPPGVERKTPPSRGPGIPARVTLTAL